MSVRVRPAQFRTIPLTQLIEQANGPEVREPVYYFGKTIKVQDIELPGQTYAWARNITPPEQESNQ
ncbi:hypothetical protein VPH219E481_0002 [Vibrio phage 219E48-1]|nr:hypothetical protein PODOV021v1_p0080 [Vibrio phage 219E41.2]QZI91053.1 hypothetical protein PODOV032v1_p0048 [Vibrio phage 219E41.1]QZI91129.1 hypothetical protein PODOV060v1_p0035 [Vibrio phage 234P8]QZI91577.1 hypothetical protein PODOV087v1_p0072 [Vibrio phage 431E45.1]QZI91639.1 hypothetical protein PODOV086v1_p0055 [Vibrio phage 431E46.1]QZI91672.1 hypothetical protein PODOV088v1_p0011 [Vibrio phage 431E48.2]